MSSLPADKAVSASAADAVDCGTPDRSLCCITVSCPIVRGSSSLTCTSLARHFLSSLLQRSHDSEAGDHVHFKHTKSIRIQENKNIGGQTFCRAMTHSSHLFCINGRARRVRLLSEWATLKKTGRYRYCVWSGEPNGEGSEVRIDEWRFGAIGTWILFKKKDG